MFSTDTFTLVLFLALIAAVCWRLARRRTRIGSAGSGAVYDLMNEDKRKAIEIVVSERAEARDPEHEDGNLPDLAGRQRKG